MMAHFRRCPDLLGRLGPVAASLPALAPGTTSGELSASARRARRRQRPGGARGPPAARFREAGRVDDLAWHRDGLAGVSSAHTATGEEVRASAIRQAGTPSELIGVARTGRVAPWHDLGHGVAG
jgi:hypothetical protein